MKDVSKETVDSFVRACQQAAGCGLMRCSSGNLSMRVDGDRLLVKASRSWMARVVPDDISLCTIADGSLLEGRKPSVEIGFHAGILRTRPDVNIVMHFQTPCATALACQKAENINTENSQGHACSPDGISLYPSGYQRYWGISCWFDSRG